MSITLSQKSIMMFLKKFLFCFGFLSFVFIKINCQNLLDYSNSLKYADFLFQTQQFHFSVIEYERIVFLAPQDTLAKLRLVQSYRFLQDYNTAQERLENFFPYNRTYVPEYFAIEYVKVLLLDHQYENAFVFLQINNKIKQPKKTEYQAGTLLLQCKWEDAKIFMDEQAKIDQRTIELDNLYNIALSGMDINYKNPTHAALLSSIMPGSGKLYTKHWKDAIYSFLFIGASSCMTFYSIRNDGISFNSVFLGAVTLSFYAANIYGSYKSAEKYNQKLNDIYKNEVESIFLK